MNRVRKEIAAAALGAAEIGNSQGRQSFRFAEEFIGFAGHFPGYPILPAVLQMLLAQLVAEQLVGAPLQFLAVKRAKFTRQLLPQTPIEVCVEQKPGQELLSFACELRTDGSRAASFTLQLGQGSAQ